MTTNSRMPASRAAVTGGTPGTDLATARVAAELGASVTVARESPRPDRTAPTQNWTIRALRPS
jgi:NAD(P)-dependent dehydrogenase (short-subunit alcohol dehydrogenase family)